MVDMAEVKAIAESLKRENGNKGLTNRDMNLYVLNKLDAIEDKLDGMVSKEDCSSFRKSYDKKASNNVTWVISIVAIAVSITVAIFSIIK